MSPANDPNALLNQLRDIHSPGDISWWPPAPGWWLLAMLGLIALAWSVHWLYRRRRRLAWRRLAREELRQLDENYHRNRDTSRLAAGLSQLLRRVALATHPAREVAGLGGEDWLTFLDGDDPAKPFSEGPGRVLLSAPYRPGNDFNPEALLQLTREWIQRQ